MIRIKLHCDWTDSDSLTDSIVKDFRHLCGLYESKNVYENIMFMRNGDFDYDYAIMLNGYLPVQENYKENIVVSFEPPEFFGDIINENVNHLFIPLNLDKSDPNNKFRMKIVFNNTLWTLHAQIEPSKIKPSEKLFRASIIQSNKMITQEQKIRSQFYHLMSNDEEIKKYIYFFGEASGNGRLLQKHDGLRDFSYSFAFENSNLPGVLTEKFYDCIVNNTIPITNNMTAYQIFDQNVFRYINLRQNHQVVMRQIKEILETPITPEQDEALLNAKKQILYGQNNIVHDLYKICNQVKSKS